MLSLSRSDSSVVEAFFFLVRVFLLAAGRWDTFSLDEPALDDDEDDDDEVEDALEDEVLDDDEEVDNEEDISTEAPVLCVEVDDDDDVDDDELESSLWKKYVGGKRRWKTSLKIVKESHLSFLIFLISLPCNNEDHGRH